MGDDGLKSRKLMRQEEEKSKEEIMKIIQNDYKQRRQLVERRVKKM